jgi:hypothetical protein
MTRRRFLLLAGAGGLAGCVTQAPPRALAWRTLAKGAQSGLAAPRREVLRDEAAWLRLWAAHAADLGAIRLPPPVDFAKEMVLAVALGPRRTGGHRVDIVGAAVEGRAIVVRVAEVAPAPGVMVPQVVTAPFHFAALPRSAAAVRFQTVAEARRRPPDDAG